MRARMPALAMQGKIKVLDDEEHRINANHSEELFIFFGSSYQAPPPPIR
jgi:hypothetical protein